MKQLILILTFFTATLGTVEAQQPRQQPGQGQKEQKIKALYVAYMTQELKLTELEAQKFWPLHAEFDNEIRAVRLDMPELERQQALLNIKKKYESRFSQILGNERVNAFYKNDAEFRKKLVERLRNMRMQNGGQRPGNPRN